MLDEMWSNLTYKICPHLALDKPPEYALDNWDWGIIQLLFHRSDRRFMTQI